MSISFRPSTPYPSPRPEESPASSRRTSISSVFSRFSTSSSASEASGASGAPTSPQTSKEDLRKIADRERAKLQRLFSRCNSWRDKLEPAASLSPDLKGLWGQRVDGAMTAVQANREKFIDDGRGLEASLRLIAEQVRDGSLPADMHKNFEKKLQAMLADHLYTEDLGPGIKGGPKYAKKEAKRLYKEGKVQSLNDRPWKPIRSSFAHAGQTFTCDMTPASHMKLGQKDIFKNQYDGTGVSSGTTKSEHATNLWATRFTMIGRDGQPKTLVSAVRHGINEAYGVKSKTKREEIALERSKEVIRATLKNIKEPELRRALQTGEPIKLNLSSASLVTAMNFLGQTEGTQMKGQVKAWNTLTEMSARDGGIEIEVNDGNTLKKVKVELEVAAFNFGVNEAALTQKIKLGPLELKLNAGWSAADKVNEAGLKKLLGDDLAANSEQGWVGDYIRNNPDAKNIELVKALREQICEIWATKSHHHAKNVDQNGKQSGIADPYKMAARVAFLSQEIDAGACYNCKSGKDRTAMMDTELKFLAACWELHGKLPKPGEKLSAEDQALFCHILLETGNAEIQKYNTGAPGNKVFKKLAFNDLSLMDRVGSAAAFDQAMGLSKLVTS